MDKTPQHESFSLPEGASTTSVAPLWKRRFSKLWMPFALYTVVLVFLNGAYLYSASRFTWQAIPLFFLGLFVWTLTEYLLHRFVFHLTRVRPPWDAITSREHTAHHRDAQSSALIVAPPVVTLGLAFLLYFVFSAMTGSFLMGLLPMNGLIAGYLFYEFVHYGSHRFAFQNRLLVYLRAYHLMHHFRYPKRMFGISSPLWDVVFKTFNSPFGESK